MKISKWNRPLSSFAGSANYRAKGGQGHTHVRWMHGDAVRADAEDRMHAVEAVNRRAPRAGLAFVASGCDVVEIGAARSLEQIAPVGGHIAYLCRCACQNRLREQRVAAFDF